MLKTIHINKPVADPLHSYADLFATAKEKESQADLKEAADLYKKCIKLKPKDQTAYDRLMIVYRKQKEYKKEIALVKSAIKVYEGLYKSKKLVSKAVTRLSKNIITSTGLGDAKGKSNFEPQPVGKWKKRLAALNKKAAAGS